MSNWPDLKNAAAPSSRARQRLENQIREVAHRRQQLTQEMERLGVEKARLLADNIELDAQVGGTCEQIADSEAVVNRAGRTGSEGARSWPPPRKRCDLRRNSRPPRTAVRRSNCNW